MPGNKFLFYESKMRLASKSDGLARTRVLETENVHESSYIVIFVELICHINITYYCHFVPDYIVIILGTK